LSKARRRWGSEVFSELFSRILRQCMKAGLVAGDVLHVDGSCIQGNVDMNRLQPVLRLTGQALYDRLEETAEPIHPSGRLTSRSDPEAGVTRKNGQTVCGYKDHRTVDDAEGIITAAVTTDAAVDEGQLLATVLEQHERNTDSRPDIVVADTQYGTADNYGELRNKGVRPCIPHTIRKSQKGLFGHDEFRYDPQRDCFICPAGQELRPYHRNKARQRIRYQAGKGTCRACALRDRCTQSKYARRVERHMHQEDIDWADGCFARGRRRHLMRRRRIRAEGTFAEAQRYGFKRARWRGLEKARIQNLLIASIQNLQKLIQAKVRRLKSACRAVPAAFFGLCGHAASHLNPVSMPQACWGPIDPPERFQSGLFR